MSNWDRKRAGAIVDAVQFYAKGVADPAMHAALNAIAQRALQTERQVSVGSDDVRALHQSLCQFCRGHDILDCEGSYQGMGCDFLEIAGFAASQQ